MASVGGRTTFRWLKPDVYPLIAAVSVGVTGSFIIMARKLREDPTVVLSKSKRGEEADPLAGERYTNSWHRRMFEGRVVGIFPNPIKRRLPEGLQNAAKEAEAADNKMATH
jgi:hypothetical protein